MSAPCNATSLLVHKMYQPRDYRNWIYDRDLTSFNVIVKETDLHIRATSNLSKQAKTSIIKHRYLLESYILDHPQFLTTLKPYSVEPYSPKIVQIMAEASQIAGVGPMAAVAGAIAQLVGDELLQFSPEIIVENGGDIYLKLCHTRNVGIYAGDNSPFSGLTFEVRPEDTPLGICTSSGTIGHSLSFGSADAVVVLSTYASLADAVATAICNRIKTVDDIRREIKMAGKRYGISGLIIIKEEQIGIWGNIKLSCHN